MKKYIPSARNNKEMLDDTLRELKGFVYSLEKGKYNKELDKDIVGQVAYAIKDEVGLLGNAIGTGKENIESAVVNVKQMLESAKRDCLNPFTNRFATSMDDLAIAVGTLKDVACGYIEGEGQESVKKDKRIQRLNEKIDEIVAIKDEFIKHESRLEADATLLEKDIAELEDKMIDCDNERILNDLYRRINSIKSKVNTLNVRRTNYSSCYNVLDMIESNAREIVIAGQYSDSEIALAKVILNMSKIRETISDPEKVIPILKLMQKNISDINEKIKSADEKMFNLAPNQDEISPDALKYKEELLKKRRAKLGLEDMDKEIQQASANDGVVNVVK